MNADVIDLRSDTVTLPTPAMREAIAAARVGDDVFGEDPTVVELQERAAALFGHEAALFVPSGTMANQLALLSWCQRGDDVIAGQGAHAWCYETGAAAAVSGVQFTLMDGALFSAEQVAEAIKPDNHHLCPTRLVMVENTHNRAGGRVFPLAQLQAISALCRDRGLGLHMDGARVFNALVAHGLSPAAVGGTVDSLSFCLSKGLGCPVGSVLVGSRAWIWRAHRFRKMLGGGMRQIGFLAAAGLHALDHHIERLADDHRRARRFAQALSGLQGVVIDLATVETNIVIFDLADAVMDAATFQARAAESGLLCYAIGPQRVRVVFHLGVDDGGTDRAAEVVGHVLRG